MNDKPFQVGALPPPPPTSPGYPPGPPQYPLAPPGGGRRRWWPRLVVAAGVGAVVAAVAAVVITVQVRDTATATAVRAPAPVTVTVPVPTPPTTAPLPVAQADRQTCDGGWIAAGRLIDSAEAARAVLPRGMKITDPAVRANPDLAAAVRKSGDFYRQAADTLEAQIAPGTTPILAEASNTAVKATRLLGYATTNFEPASGNAFTIADRAANQMGILCTRLAP